MIGWMSESSVSRDSSDDAHVDRAGHEPESCMGEDLQHLGPAGQAIDGPLEGEQLEVVPHRNEFWFAWASFLPDGGVYGNT